MEDHMKNYNKMLTIDKNDIRWMIFLTKLNELGVIGLYLGEEKTFVNHSPFGTYKNSNCKSCGQLKEDLDFSQKIFQEFISDNEYTIFFPKTNDKEKNIIIKNKTNNNTKFTIKCLETYIQDVEYFALSAYYDHTLTTKVFISQITKLENEVSKLTGIVNDLLALKNDYDSINAQNEDNTKI